MVSSIVNNNSIWTIDGTLTGSTTPSESEPGSNSNEEVFLIPENSKTTASSSGAV